MNRRVVALERLHQVVAGQVFVSGIDAIGLFARNVHKPRQPGARADEYRVVAFFVEQFVDGHGFADDDVRFDLDAEALDVFNFLGDNFFLRQTEFWNPVNQNAARFVERFENRHVVALLGQFRGAGQPGRASADHSDLLARREVRFFRHDVVFPCPVRDKAFQLANGDGFAFDAHDTRAFALGFLWADAAADRRQQRGFLNRLERVFKLAFADQVDKLRNVNRDRAAPDASRFFTIQAAFRFRHRFFFIVAV